MDSVFSLCYAIIQLEVNLERKMTGNMVAATDVLKQRLGRRIGAESGSALGLVYRTTGGKTAA